MKTEDDINESPMFLAPLKDLEVNENSIAHLETRLIPLNDQSLEVKWFHEGKELDFGSRIRTAHDFGCVILDISNVLARDSGKYTCAAKNNQGEASISCHVQVKEKKTIDNDPQLLSFQTESEAINNLEGSMTNDIEFKAPEFVTSPRDISCLEGQAAHFDCRVEPIGDGSMTVEWYHNDRPIQIGSRIHTIKDFGFVILDIDWTFIRDSGVYKCVASNNSGKAEASVKLTCMSNKEVDYQNVSLNRMNQLEETEISIPKFITKMKSRPVTNGTPAHLECRVEPKNDPNLQIRWYHDGQEVDNSDRFRLTFDFGYAALDILATGPADEGEYICKAWSKLGEDTTKCQLKFKDRTDTKMEKSDYAMKMEAAMKTYSTEMYLTENDIYDSNMRKPPHFVTQIQSITTLEEMQSSKFECQLSPVGDPDMKVEWFCNGKPLPSKARCMTINNFGYVAINFEWIYPEDSGEYICRASNLYGSDETRAIIKCSGKTGIVYDSQLPKGMTSIAKIRAIESGFQKLQPNTDEPESENHMPIFGTKPEAVTITEGGKAKFSCRVTAYPKARVMWLINGKTVINGRRYKLINDGMWHLEIPECKEGGKIEVVARNQCGESYAATTLTIKKKKFGSAKAHNVKPPVYKQPDWLIEMDEIKQRLAETKQAPKIIREIQECRIKEGNEASFKAGFAGNPKPDITWYFKGKIIENSEKVKISVEEDNTTLTLADVAQENAGHYECKAVSKLGSDKTKANLTLYKGNESDDKADTRNI